MLITGRMGEMGVIPIMEVVVDVMIVQITFPRFSTMEVIPCGRGIGIRIVSTNGGIERCYGGMKTPRHGVLLTG